MAKKIINIVLFSGLVAVLVIGGINRTQAKSPNANDHSSELAYINSTYSEERGTQGNPQRGKGLRGRSNNTGTSGAEEIPEIQYQTVDLFTVETIVDTVSGDRITLKANNGDTFEIEGRAWSYALDQGFDPEAGDQISLTGYYDAQNYFKVTSLVNINTGEGVIIRDEYGQPMWAGFRDSLNQTAD